MSVMSKPPTPVAFNATRAIGEKISSAGEGSPTLAQVNLSA
jgi:hypothetical protein